MNRNKGKQAIKAVAKQYGMSVVEARKEMEKQSFQDIPILMNEPGNIGNEFHAKVNIQHQKN